MTPTAYIRRRDGRYWEVTFQGVTSMPEGVPIPLPFTADAGFSVVATDLLRRFRGIAVSWDENVDLSHTIPRGL